MMACVSSSDYITALLSLLGSASHGVDLVCLVDKLC